MSDIVMSLTSLEGILSFALFFVPGSIFYTIVQNYAFPTGRYNLTPISKLVASAFISLCLILCYLLIKDRGWIADIYKAITELLIPASNNLSTELKEIGGKEVNIKRFVILFKTSILSICLGVGITTIFKLIRSQFIEQSLQRSVIPNLVYLLTCLQKSISSYGNYRRSRFQRVKSWLSPIKYYKLLNLILFSIVSLIVSVICIIIPLPLTLLAFVIIAIDFILYNLTLLFNHPLYASIHRFQKWKQVPIIEIKTKSGVLYKGILHSFDPKNRSELESISLREVISYIPKKEGGPSLSSKNRDEVYSFGHRHEYFSIPYEQIENYNIWHFSGNILEHINWPNTSPSHQDKINLWYLRILLKTHKYILPPEYSFTLPLNKQARDDLEVVEVVFAVTKLLNKTLSTKGLGKSKREDWANYLIEASQADQLMQQLIREDLYLT